jgi:methylmalonyl-CoA/ethylmalonyl-CoA epimerase
MLDGFCFHHIGYAVKSISGTASFYTAAGYCAGKIVSDPIQRTKICFLSHKYNPRIELVEPDGEESSVNKILGGGGAVPYHVCYEVDDIDRDFDALLAIGYIPLFRPVEAAAFEDRRICYFYKKEIGYIELVNKT